MAARPLRIAFLGTPDFAVPTLAALLEAGHEVACVYAQPPAARGRGQAVRPSPVQAFAEARGLPVRTPASMRAPEAIAEFKALALDAAVVVAYGQILVREVLEAPRLGMFNLHGSLLPRWRGAAPIQRAVMAGDPLTGVQVMRMGEGLDEGPVLLTATTRIGAEDTAGDLHDRLSQLGAGLMVEALDLLGRGAAAETPQAEAGLTYARKIKAEEARLDWAEPAAALDRRIRGLSPFPGAWFLMARPDGGAPVRVKALRSRFEAELDARGAAPGQLLDDRLAVAAGAGEGAGAVRLLRLQREGRAAQDAADFLRGFPVAPGDVLG